MSFRAAEWTTKYINDLPDSAFAFIAPAGRRMQKVRRYARATSGAEEQ
jgi:hypothetical protein